MLLQIWKKLRGQVINRWSLWRARIVKLPPLATSSNDPYSICGPSQGRLLNDQEIARLREQIFSDRALWKSQSSIWSSIGVSGYMFDQRSAAEAYPESSRILYSKMIKESNPILWDRYGWLYEKLKSYLQSALPADARIEYKETDGLPGIHIFQVNKEFETHLVHAHVDRQYEALRFSPEEEINFSATLSFTLAVQLPVEGGGILFYDNAFLSGSHWRFVPDLIKEFFMPKFYIPYKEGYILTQNGNVLHRIAPSKVSNQGHDDNWRITIQGHGVYDQKSKVWRIFW